MRIISRGRKPEEQLFKGTCSSCKTVFECKRGEGTYDYGNQRDGPFLSVNCPLCGKSAFAYPRNDAQPIPNYDRDRYTWSGMAQQMADSTGFPGDH
jgi:hypothetical protein